GQIPADRSLSIIVDAVDQLDATARVDELNWLPMRVPGNVRIILSGADDRGKHYPLLAELRDRGIREVVVERLLYKERLDILRTVPLISAKVLDQKQIGLLLDNPATGNPLFLTVVLEELRCFGSFERLNEKIRSLTSTQGEPGVVALFRQIIFRIESDCGDAWVDAVLGYIASSQRGLSESELGGILSLHFRDAADVNERLQLVLRQLRPFMQRCAQYLDFYHRSFREAVHEHCLQNSEARIRFHRTLACHFELTTDIRRKLEEYPYQLMLARDWSALVGVLKDLSFFIPLLTFNRSEAMKYWAQVESNSPFRISEAYKHYVENPHQAGIPDMWTLATFLGEMGYANDKLKILKFYAERTGELGDRKLRSAALGNYASSLMEAGEYGQARSLYEEEERLCREAGDVIDLQTSLSNQCCLFVKIDEYEKALAKSMEAEELCRTRGYEPGLVACLLSQAGIFMVQGDLTKAAERLDQGGEICRKTNNPLQLSKYLFQRGDVFRLSGDMVSAMKAYEEAESIVKDFGLLKDFAGFLNNKGTVYMHSGRVQEALDVFKECEKISRKYGDEVLAAMSLVNQALILKRFGEFDEAIRLLRISEDELRSRGEIQHLCICLANQIAVHQQRGDFGTAKSLFEKLGSLIKKQEDHFMKGILYSMQSTFFREQADFKRALYLERKAEEIYRCEKAAGKVCMSLVEQAGLLIAQKKYTEAMEVTKEVEKICKELGNMPEMARTMGIQSIINFHMGLSQKALQKVELAVNVAFQAEAMDIALEYKWFRDILRDPKRFNLDQNRQFINSILSRKRNSEWKNDPACLGQIAALYKERGDTKAELLTLVEQERLCLEANNRSLLGRCLVHQAIL
ncbi:tetratricopeptide repeat protein, partial [candidate division CSSED10-310 bacterium]